MTPHQSQLHPRGASDLNAGTSKIPAISNWVTDRMELIEIDGIRPRSRRQEAMSVMDTKPAAATTPQGETVAGAARVLSMMSIYSAMM